MPIAVTMIATGFIGPSAVPSTCPNSIPRQVRTGAQPASFPQALESAVAIALSRAHVAGIWSVWTGTCSGSIELARLAGPQRHEFTLAQAIFLGLTDFADPWELSDQRVRVAVYQRALTVGTQFDVYRWVNLVHLAAVWPALRLPCGVRSEWQRVVNATALGAPPQKAAMNPVGSA